MKAARMVAQAEKEGRDIRELDLPTVPSLPGQELAPCPHCGRRFSPTAHERHVKVCASIQAKPRMLARGSGGPSYSGARR
jgi:hypothetical protein